MKRKERKKLREYIMNKEKTLNKKLEESIEKLESFNELKRYTKIYKKYNFKELETYSWWENPFIFNNINDTGRDYSEEKKEKAEIMRYVFRELGGQGYANWNKEIISGNIIALKFYQKFSGCSIKLKDFERCFDEAPKISDGFIDTLNKFYKDFLEIMENTEISKTSKKMQEFINF